MVKPSCPTSASDVQGDGGGFFSITVPLSHLLSLIVLYHKEYSIWNRGSATSDTFGGSAFP